MLTGQLTIDVEQFHLDSERNGDHFDVLFIIKVYKKLTPLYASLDNFSCCKILTTLLNNFSWRTPQADLQKNAQKYPLKNPLHSRLFYSLINCIFPDYLIIMYHKTFVCCNDCMSLTFIHLHASFLVSTVPWWRSNRGCCIITGLNINLHYSGKYVNWAANVRIIVYTKI